MKKTLKKSLALLLAAVMLFAASPIIGVDFSTLANAADLNDLALTLINGDTEFEISACGWHASGDLIIPASYDGVPITSIGELAFYDCESLDSITIPESVKNIGVRAFQYCKGIKSITIPSNVTSMGEYAFYYCSNLENITFAEGSKLRSIDSSTFEGCSKIESIIIPEGVTSIDENAFFFCQKLKNVTIPSSVTSIGDEAFYYCDSLESVNIPSSVTSIGEEAFDYCNSLESVNIPSSVTSIGKRAFNSCSSLFEISVAESNANYSSVNGVLFSKDGKTLVCYPAGKSGTSYDIPSSVTSIGEAAFENCTGLTSVNIPSSMTSIGKSAFAGCSGLTSVNIPSSVTSIGMNAFYDTAYYNDNDNWTNETLYIDDCLIEVSFSCASCDVAEDTRLIADAAFYNAYELMTIFVPESNTYYSSASSVLYSKAKDVLVAYPGARIGTSFVFPNSVTSIAAYAFYSCSNLESIDIPSTVTSIGNNAFDSCESLERVTISEGVTSIENETFEDCESLKSVIISEGVTSIGEKAFEDCESLESVTIPESVKYIGEDAFEDCDDILDVYYGGDESDWENVYLGPDNGEILDPVWHYSIVVTDVALDITSKTLVAGTTQQLTATVTPDNATNTAVVYTSSDTSIATVDKNGLVTAKSVGTATITVRTKNKSKTETCEITVINPVIAINNLNSSASINYGETLRLTAVTTEMPAGAKLAWSVQGSGVMLKVSEDTLTCEVTSIASGSVSVTATIVDAEDKPITGADGEDIAVSQQIESKAGFFQKLISFFKNLFKISRIIVQSIDR